MLWIFVWLGFAVVTAVIASSKGRSSVLWGILGCIFGIFAFLAIAFMAPISTNQPQIPQSSTRPTPPRYAGIEKDRVCPHCNRPLSIGAAKCRECGATLSWSRVQDTGVLTPSLIEAPSASKDEGLGTQDKTCPDCAETVKGAARVCRYCGYRFEKN